MIDSPDKAPPPWARKCQPVGGGGVGGAGSDDECHVGLLEVDQVCPRHEVERTLSGQVM